MNRKFLLIVEGSKDEPNLLTAIFQQYGKRVKTLEQIRVDLAEENFRPFIIEQDTYKIGEDEVFIAQGPRNRLTDLLKVHKKDTLSFDRLFLGASGLFAGIFLIYDVDHTSNDDLVSSFEKFRDESSGMLLLSSPCLEILVEHDRTQPIEYEHLDSYKKELNIRLNNTIHCSIVDYIAQNFDSLALYYLNKNHDDFNCNNVMEHPQKIIDEINAKNFRGIDERSVNIVKYRYFTSVVYVCVAFIMGLTKFPDNYELVKSFFEKRIRDKIN